MNVGIIGGGGISITHIEALKNVDEVQVTAVADINEEKLAAMRNNYGLKTYSNYRDMIAQENIDSVLICLPHGLHCAASVYAAEHGKNIMLEKPMANNIAQCLEIIRAAENNHVKLMIGHIQHYFSENNAVRKLLASGELGKLASVTDIRNIDYFVKSRPGWFFNRELSGGGILLNYGAHSLDKINWITGLEIVDVCGRATQKLDGREIEGGAQLFAQLEDDVTAIISYSGYKSKPVNETVFYCTEGSVKLMTGYGVWVSRGGEYERYDVKKEDEFALMWHDFADCVINDMPSPVSGEYGMKVVAAVEKIYLCGKNQL